MRVPNTKSRTQKQPPPPKMSSEEAAVAIVELHDKLSSKMKIVHAANQLEALAAQVTARQRLIRAADALLPKAAALAEKGKPRLLAVLTKIINDRNIKFGQK